MSKIGDIVGKADWKTEKHVPVIDCPGEVKADQMFDVKVSVGKEVSHPNTTAHHITWISLYFHAEGEKFAHQIGRVDFSAHGESTEGADAGPVHTHHQAVFTMATKKSGKLYAVSMCNIHGLWESDKDIKVA
ncbi:MAG: class II SORL domain-containing protein [Thermoplasmata archaeon]|nr:class II SORL domain-containing protein [Thermoplasmata archaeon]